MAVLASLLTAAALWIVPKFLEWPSRQLVPSHAVVAFNQAACPPGWAPFDLGRGRYVVGLNDRGTLRGVEGKELSDKENRPTGQHDHPFKDASLGGEVEVGVGKGSWQRQRNTPYKTDPSEGTSGVPGTNAPYVQLLYCERD